MGPVMWLQNTGLLDKFFIDSQNPPPVIPLKKVRDNEPLIIEQLVTAAIVLLVGLVLATLVFLGEHFRISRHSRVALKPRRRRPKLRRNVRRLAELT